MKSIFLSAALSLTFLSGFNAFAEVRSNYLILVKSDVLKDSQAFAECVREVSDIANIDGSGELEVRRGLGIIGTDLSQAGVEQVRALSCVQQVREEGTFELGAN